MEIENKKYLVTMTREFLVLAKDTIEAEEKAIELCADDPEALIPHNMDVVVSASDLPDSFFNSN